MKGQKRFDKNHWLKMVDNPKYRAWSGYAFEQVCLAHVPLVKKALGISGVRTETYSWRSNLSADGAQIDLVIDRRDGVVNLCEMKFNVKPFVIDKKYDAELRNKTEVFRRETGTNKALHFVMITPYGLQETLYSGSIPNSLKMDVLFEHE